VLVGKVAGGMAVDEVAAEYQVTREDVLAALSYATRRLEEEQVRAIS
jgi:uncharacterized protein (DUF433 family)